MSEPTTSAAEQMRMLSQMPDEALEELDKLTRRIDCLGERVRWEIRERRRRRQGEKAAKHG